ncbi:MAG TPA: large conductance mechanosensitive channel protein MscL [Clostridiales bacterium]|nr:large conductance mechanosensitive channel protein MscL [Clostridiales bacterium]
MWEEFKKFALKGNVMDMAIGVIIGGAFGKIVSSFVNDIMMPLLGIVLGRVDLSALKWVIREENESVAGLTLSYGMFLQNTLDFIIIALSIFFMVKLISKMKKKEVAPPPKPAVPPAPSKEEVLLAEIRDLLKKK